MTSRKDLKAQVQLIDSLIEKVIPMPDLDDLKAVVAYLNRAPEVAENGLKTTVFDLCEGYLEDLKAT